VSQRPAARSASPNIRSRKKVPALFKRPVAPEAEAGSASEPEAAAMPADAVPQQQD
jgi:hypothetical protein